MDLRSRIIRLANEFPETRVHLVPLLQKHAMEFSSPEALKKYLHDHPNADKSKHSVKDSDEIDPDGIDLDDERNWRGWESDYGEEEDVVDPGPKDTPKKNTPKKKSPKMEAPKEAPKKNRPSRTWSKGVTDLQKKHDLPTETLHEVADFIKDRSRAFSGQASLPKQKFLSQDLPSDVRRSVQDMSPQEFLALAGEFIKDNQKKP